MHRSSVFLGVIDGVEPNCILMALAIQTNGVNTSSINQCLSRSGRYDCQEDVRFFFFAVR